MSDPVAAVGGFPPSPSFSDDPIQSKAPPADALMCIAPESAGAEGAGGAGTDALVRRFAQGSGGRCGAEPQTSAPSSCPEERNADSCVGETVSAMATCGGILVGVVSTAGLGALISGALCFSSLDALIECLDDR